MTEKYGRLSVIEVVSEKRNGKSYRMAKCVCDCGKLHSAKYCAVKSGNTSSCGCYYLELIKLKGQKNKTHGDTVGRKISREFVIWSGMKQRCYDPACRAYADYGARGIVICERWERFENFLADMGRCPKGHSIERVDVNGNYCPENCKWIPSNLQSKNRRNVRHLTFEGTTDNMSQWARRMGISPGTLHYFLARHGNEEGMRQAASTYGYKASA